MATRGGGRRARGGVRYAREKIESPSPFIQRSDLDVTRDETGNRRANNNDDNDNNDNDEIC